jgi:hypothetical protein
MVLRYVNFQERTLIAMRTNVAPRRWLLAMFLFLFALDGGCTKESGDVLAPYGGAGRPLSKIVVQDSTFAPRVTWLGGYVSVFAINKGKTAKLDSTLVWLIYMGNNAITYPVTLNSLPPGAQDLTASYGGHTVTRLSEDVEYTYWVLKDEAWAEVSAHPGKPIAVDTLTSSGVKFVNDTVVVSHASLTVESKTTDVYINIKDLVAYGRLVTDVNTFQTYLNVKASDTCNQPVVTWTVKQAGVTDQNIAAIGICAGGEYQVSQSVWEMISKDVQPDTVIYWKNNVISSPIRMGTEVAGTETFKQYPIEGLHRGESYYLWIANKDWDQKSRIRSAKYYAYATFNVW